MIKPGTIVQLVFATLLSLVFLVIQHSVAPYANRVDNFIAVAASFALAVLFFSCILLKLGVLVELDGTRLSGRRTPAPLDCVSCRWSRVSCQWGHIL